MNVYDSVYRFVDRYMRFACHTIYVCKKAQELSFLSLTFYNKVLPLVFICSYVSRT